MLSGSCGSMEQEWEVHHCKAPKKAVCISMCVSVHWSVCRCLEVEKNEIIFVNNENFNNSSFYSHFKFIKRMISQLADGADVLQNTKSYPLNAFFYGYYLWDTGVVVLHNNLCSLS